MRSVMRRRWVLKSAAWAVLVAASVPLGACAYYNTFYLARKYYERGTGGLPYVVEKPDPKTTPHFDKSIEYSKKVLGVYPRSKWVDDAHLLWARALLGKDDPIETMNMLREFSTRYPKSPLKDEARFYLGVAGRKARKYGEALAAVDEFLERAPNHELAPYAHLERSRIFSALERHDEAAAAAGRVLERFPKSRERDRALLTRAEALLARGEHDRARADFRRLGAAAKSDESRFSFLLREADCLESARLYAEELALLRGALAHEQEPQPNPTPGAVRILSPSNERYGRLLVRIGTVHMLEGRVAEALAAYRRVVEDFVRTPLAAEAQYRVGYVQETLADDFEAARSEYAKVAQQSGTSPYATQANQRLTSLERLAQFRGEGQDSLSRRVEADLMLAEIYLFQLDKPDRALAEYQRIARDHAGTPYAGRAMNAEAWVFRNKLGRPEAADSVWWTVVRGYPGTEAQLDARDYLERVGHMVPAELIRLPERPAAPAAGGVRTAGPAGGADSVRRAPPRSMPRDSLLRFEPDRESSGAPQSAPDTLSARAAADTSGPGRASDLPDSAAASAPGGAGPGAPDSAAARP